MTQDPAKSVVEEKRRASFFARRRSTMLLGIILIVAGTLRFASLEIAPPGLNQDEAANAWNAYTLLKTGKDQVGKEWPIFYSHALGGNRTTLFLYYLIPFLGVGGLNIWTLRVASAFAGVMAVLLGYVVGARLFNRTVGMMAAALLALSPWHIQQSRWGHEASIAPLLVLLSIAMLLWADLPIDEKPKRKFKPLVALLAGAVIGISCYGYAALRIFLPLLFLGVFIVTWRGWWNALKTKRGAFSIAMMIMGVTVTFGPLVWEHITDAGGIGQHGQILLLWNESDSTGVKVGKVLHRYAAHFGPDFLFQRGDHQLILSPPGMGQLHWYMLPLMLAGLVCCISRFRTSAAARVLFVWVLAYPLGDCISQHVSLHALRSLPGAGGLVLLGALGAVGAGEWLLRKNRRVAIAAMCGLGVAVIILNVLYLPVFFGDFNRNPNVYYAYHVDLLEACEWLKPRMETTDAVFVTTQMMNQPYIVTLVALEYDPERWFEEAREYTTPDEWDIYTRYGKMRFMYGGSWVKDFDELARNGETDRAVFVLRPGAEYEQLRGPLKLGPPVHIIRRPDGTEMLYICQRDI